MRYPVDIKNRNKDQKNNMKEEKEDETGMIPVLVFVGLIKVSSKYTIARAQFVFVLLYLVEVDGWTAQL